MRRIFPGNWRKFNQRNQYVDESCVTFVLFRPIVDSQAPYCRYLITHIAYTLAQPIAVPKLAEIDCRQS